MADGIRVPEGSHLLGPLRTGDAVGGEGWSAVLAVDGTGEVALTDAMDQFERRGLALRGGCSEYAFAEGSTSCRIGAYRFEDGFVRERASATLEVSEPGAPFGYVSELEISYGRWPPGALAAQAEGQQLDYEGIGPFPTPDPPPPIPGVDEPMSATADDVFRVVPGTRVVAPVRTLGDCLGGFLAHVQVTGDLDEVIDETRDRFDDLSGVDGTTVEHGEARGHETVEVVGGGDAHATMDIGIGNDDEPTWATVEYRDCGD